MGKDFISFLERTRRELFSLLDHTEVMRTAFSSGQPPGVLEGKAVALIWDAEGFRNRVAFELGIQRMGGVAIQIPGLLDDREPIEDVARYLDNWFQLAMGWATSSIPFKISWLGKYGCKYSVNP